MPHETATIVLILGLLKLIVAGSGKFWWDLARGRWDHSFTWKLRDRSSTRKGQLSNLHAFFPYISDPLISWFVHRGDYCWLPTTFELYFEQSNSNILLRVVFVRILLLCLFLCRLIYSIWYCILVSHFLRLYY